VIPGGDPRAYEEALMACATVQPQAKSLIDHNTFADMLDPDLVYGLYGLILSMDAVARIALGVALEEDRELARE
jgi:hypothetical protein